MASNNGNIPRRVARMYEMYNEGIAIRKITKTFGYSSASGVYYQFKKNHLPLKGRQKKFSYEDLIFYLKLAAVKANRTPGIARYNRVKEAHWPSDQLIMMRFGTWSNALEAAGMTPNPRPPQIGISYFSDEDYQNALIVCASDIGEVPSMTKYREWASYNQDFPGVDSIRKYYGSWQDAIAAAGFDKCVPV